ncbi:hypothetical protein CRG98_016578 [Punica granatum]|uniref:Transposase MuDR plant domain-containing protein n=1 Tax=Punica granatum TaxID=22663 RepID=A0A2I0K322_PUNGR|nr:hypothetical protein CRG98_016578 [Punica granatum]
MKNSSSFTQQAATDHREIGGDLSILSGAAAAGQGGVGVGGRSWSWSQWNGRLKQQLVGQEQEARTAAAGRRSGWSKREQHVVVEQEQQRLPGAAMIATPVREGLERTAEALDERVRVGDCWLFYNEKHPRLLICIANGFQRLPKAMNLCWALIMGKNVLRNDDEVGEENNLEGYDVDGQEDYFEYGGTEHVDSGVYWNSECIFNEDAEGHLDKEEERIGEGSDPENGEQIVVSLSPTIADMVISSDEEQGYISEELVDNCISDDDKGDDELGKYPEFDENAMFGEVQLELQMLFPNLTMFKKAVTDYNVSIGRVFKFVKNDNERVRAKCRSEGCKWEIYCSWSNEVKTFKVKKFVEPHTCARGFKNKQANKKWLAAQLVDELRSYPTMSAHDAFEWFKRGLKQDADPSLGWMGVF